jgi:hypothetical protein
MALNGNDAISQPAGFVAHVDKLEAGFFGAPRPHVLQVHHLDSPRQLGHRCQRIPSLRGAPTSIERHANQVFVALAKTLPHVGGALLRMILDRVGNAMLAQNRYGGCAVLGKKLNVPGNNRNIQGGTKPARAVQVVRIARHPCGIAAHREAVRGEQCPRGRDMLQRGPVPVQVRAPEVDGVKPSALTSTSMASKRSGNVCSGENQAWVAVSPCCQPFSILR